MSARKLSRRDKHPLQNHVHRIDPLLAPRILIPGLLFLNQKLVVVKQVNPCRNGLLLRAKVQSRRLLR